MSGIPSQRTQDTSMVERQGEGPIVDRSLEKLSATDAPLIKMRAILLEACRDLQRGVESRNAGHPEAYSTVAIEGVSNHTDRSAQVPRPENRWAGQNRGGWSNAEYDRVWQLFDTTLGAGQRDRHAAELERILYEDVGAIPNLFTVVVNARAGSLQGPRVKQTPDAAISALYTHQWEWIR